MIFASGLKVSVNEVATNESKAGQEEKMGNDGGQRDETSDAKSDVKYESDPKSTEINVAPDSPISAEDELENVNVRERRKLFLQQQFNPPLVPPTIPVALAKIKAQSCNSLHTTPSGSDDDGSSNAGNDIAEEVGDDDNDDDNVGGKSFVQYIVLKFDGMTKSATV